MGYTIDFEATSEQFYIGRIFQCACLEFDDEQPAKVSKWKLYNKYFAVKTELSIENRAVTKTNKQELEELSEGILFEEGYQSILPFFTGKERLVGHNIQGYDLLLLNSNLKKAGVEELSFEGRDIFDTLRYVKSKNVKLPQWVVNSENKKLGTLFYACMRNLGHNREEADAFCDKAARLLGATDHEIHAHNAVYDVIMNTVLYSQLIK